MKYREYAKVLECVRIGNDIFSLKLAAEQIAAAAKPGQFVSVYANDSARLLPRPISVCEADVRSGILRLVFRIAGAGTREFSRLEEGERVMLVGPLGNGFPLERAEAKRVFLIGGGIGIPPMLELAKRLTSAEGEGTGSFSMLELAKRLRVCDGEGDAEDQAERAVDVKAVLGYRDERFLLEDFPCETVVATEDGSFGTRGTVLDAIRAHGLTADVIYACGPIPMLRALKQYALESGTECWLSMEEKMACGIGACLSCVCRSTEIDEHSQVKNKRVCTEGPVFLSTEIEL